MNRYDVNSIMESPTLPIGAAGKRLKDVSEHTEMSVDGRRTGDDILASQLTDGMSNYGPYNYQQHGWPTIAFQQPQPLGYHYPYIQPRGWCKPELDSTVAGQTYQDFQQHNLGNNTYNFMQPTLIHNLMSMEPSSMEHSMGSGSVNYSGGIGGGHESYHDVVGANSGYAMPLNTMVVDPNQTNQASSSIGETEGKQIGYENMFAQNVYYHSQQQSGAANEQSISSNTWMQPSAQTVEEGSQQYGGSHGIPLFQVWGDQSDAT